MPLWAWLLIGFVVGLNATVIALLCVYGARRARIERRWLDARARLSEWNVEDEDWAWPR